MGFQCSHRLINKDQVLIWRLTASRPPAFRELSTRWRSWWCLLVLGVVLLFPIWGTPLKVHAGAHFFFLFGRFLDGVKFLFWGHSRDICQHSWDTPPLFGLACTVILLCWGVRQGFA